MEDEKQREPQVTLIPTTTSQDNSALEFVKSHSEMNGINLFDNCAVRTNQLLNASGITTQGFPFPGGTARDVQSIPGSITYFIPQGAPIPKQLQERLGGFSP